jgi:hypothetical protein
VGRRSARALPSKRPIKGSVDLCGRGPEGLQLMRQSLGGHQEHPKEVRLSTFQSLVRPLLGRPCWSVEYESQLNLKLSFGRPSIHVLREPGQQIGKPGRGRWSGRRIVTVRAEYWLWVYLARWKVTLADGRSATMAGGGRARDVVLNTLKGEKVTEVRVQPSTGATRIAFDLGGVLEIHRLTRRTPEDLWLLYKPRGLVLTVRGDGTYAHGPGSKAKERWRPVENVRGAA